MSLSGAANFGIINNGTTNAKSDLYQNISVTAAMSSETDNGLTFGASLTVRSGDDVDLDVGDLGTNANPLTKALSDVSFGNIYVSGAFGKLTIDRDGLDNLHNDAFSHDVMYEYSVGSLSFAMTADIDNNGAAYKDGEEFSVRVIYNAAPLKVTILTDDGGEYDATVDYAVNDMIGLRLNYDTNGQTVNGKTEAETIIRASYASGAFSGHIALADDEDDQWEIGLGYKASGVTLGAVIAENDGKGETEMDLTAEYDLGGGMSLLARTNESGAYFVGAALKF